MLFHISTDRIIFINWGERVILPYGELEKNLPDFLYKHLSANADLDQGSRVTVINGPGSFTNLRIATLALNTYNMLHNFWLDFVSIGKIEHFVLEKREKKKDIRRYCLMYIGQKKNFWVVDLERSEQGIVNLDAIVKLHVDNLKEYVDKLGDDWFVDEMVAEGKEMMDSLFGEEGYMMYSFEENYELQITNYESVKLLVPNYMIDSNIES